MNLPEITLIVPENIQDLLDQALKKTFKEIITYGSKTLGDGQTLEQAILQSRSNIGVLVKEGAVPFISAEGALTLVKPVLEGSSLLSFSNYKQTIGDTETEVPLIDYQVGSIRDDFDFGPMWAINIEKAKSILPQINNLKETKVSGWYSLRLRLCTDRLPVRIPNSLYSVKSPERKLGYEEQFSYVDSKNRASQIELESAFTAFAKQDNFFLSERKELYAPNLSEFKVKASIVIPVRDRHKTIGDAVKSALSQKTNFAFNVIVVDNHSTDGTTKLLADIAANDPRLVHICPEEKDLLIGGCWNKGINSKECGAFAVQLDSDDLYISENTLQKIIDKFEEEGCAAVVGSYNLVDFNLKDIPPGLIDHKEWTPENGHNNALRIHGLGAPRAIATAVARQIKFENVSYGEDYAMMLAICRSYKLGRIYESLYLCRRWDGNSDANLSIEKKNKNNIYKDLIRSREVLARKALVSQLKT